jgi:23S rRNA (adenine2503-C2)-methyltransferase
MVPPISVYDAVGMDRLRRELRLDPARIRRLRAALLKRFAADQTAVAGIPAPERLLLHPLRLRQRRDSALDGASKLLLQTADGLLVETVVLRSASGRSTVCVSSQVGCAAACDFCATGKRGLARNLQAEEILDQVVQAGQLLAAEGRLLRNIVFMGMGEPLHNEQHVHRSLDMLLSAAYFHRPPTKITVSTVGIVDALRRLIQRYPAVRLAVSLHSVRQDVRERLMPAARRQPLGELRRAIGDANRAAQAAVMIEYLLLAGINDSPRDAQELVDWLRGLNVHVNLIPYNAINAAPHLTGSDGLTREAFSQLLKVAGVKTTTRHSLGRDIDAACGQLARHSERALAAP